MSPTLRKELSQFIYTLWNRQKKKEQESEDKQKT